MEFSLSWWLNVSGLVIGTIAAVLMFYFPPRLEIYTPEGARDFNWTTEPTEEGRRIAQRQAFWAKAAPVLLVLLLPFNSLAP